jgi:hypothetical protein
VWNAGPATTLKVNAKTRDPSEDRSNGTEPRKDSEENCPAFGPEYFGLIKKNVDYMGANKSPHKCTNQGAFHFFTRYL